MYIYHVAVKLNVQVKGTGLSEGIEIFPKQDELRESEFGNAVRAPLGVHRGARESQGFLPRNSPVMLPRSRRLSSQVL
jgi:hypothetical protein